VTPQQAALFGIDQRRTEQDLLSDLLDAGMILAMGPEGIGDDARNRMRRELLDAAEALRERWDAP
jgi:hypothetical protein